MRLGYMRVSTTDGRQTLDMQKDSLESYGVDRVFEDMSSGAKFNREGLTRLLDASRAGDEIVVYKLDRLGRSVKEMVNLIDDLNNRGVNFVSLTEGLNTSTPAGKFQLHILLALAQMEKDLLRERVKAGLEAAARRGRKGGRPPKLTENQLKMARKAIADGETMTDVAASFSVDRTTLWRALRT